MKVVCIIQARIGSTRLPGKVMKTLYDKTFLQHVVERIRKVNNINEIVIATTLADRDEVIAKEAERIGVKCYRGSEDNVLQRYYHAAKEVNADVVVRITSDCPLIDHEITEAIVQFYIDHSSEYDYVSNTIDRTYPRGLDTEVFSYKALEKAFREAMKERDLEHVTPYIWSNNALFKLFQYKNDKDYSNLRWTLDTQEDFELIRRLYSYLYTDKEHNFNMLDIIAVMDQHPELYEINQNIEQKHI